MYRVIFVMKSCGHNIKDADFKENLKNPTHEPDALAELVIPSALILLENKLSDNLIADVIIPSRELCLIRRKTPAFRPQKPSRVSFDNR